MGFLLMVLGCILVNASLPNQDNSVYLDIANGVIKGLGVSLAFIGGLIKGEDK